MKRPAARAHPTVVVPAHAELIARLAVALDGRGAVRLASPTLRAAAVAVLLVERDGETWVPMIERGADAPTHSGQIALPGGGFDPRDADLVATARREAEEELGVPRAAPRVLGTLDDVPTPTGYAITPVVAELAATVQVVPNPREVASWFWVPFARFVDRTDVEVLGVRQWDGRAWTMRAYPYQGHRIWGATARILEAVVELAGGPPRE
ncbi:MAG: CoA pyrophosphatase [Kofleriaceae bacterium]